MGADKAGDRSAAGAAGRPVKLKVCRASMVRDVWDRLFDFCVATWLGLLDRLAPRPETEVDRAIREEGERLRRAFPWLFARIKTGGPVAMPVHVEVQVPTPPT